MSEGAMEGHSKYDARVDSLKCKGLCVECCELIPYPKRIRDLYPGLDLPANHFQVTFRTADGKKPCPFLTEGRCSIYANRPALCRLWGNTERLRCPFGCEREGPLLTYKEGFRYLRKHGEGSYL